jgi:hypothetical protein
MKITPQECAHFSTHENVAFSPQKEFYFFLVIEVHWGEQSWQESEHFSSLESNFSKVEYGDLVS